MKKVLLIFMMILSSVYYSNAQETVKHLEFMGIPIDGNIVSFVSKLEQKGFTQSSVERDGTIYVLKGTFAGLNNCKVYVLSTPKSKTVGKVVVFSETYGSWDNVKDAYEKFKEIYDKKYKIKKEFSFFSYPYEEGDGYERSALRNNKCYYQTFYEEGENLVVLEIYEDFKLQFGYEDHYNFYEKKHNEEDDLITTDI